MIRALFFATRNHPHETGGGGGRASILPGGVSDPVVRTGRELVVRLIGVVEESGSRE